MSDDPFDSAEWHAYSKRVREELVPKIEASAITMSLIPEGEVDIKFAVELGLSILLDKPLIAVIQPGMKVSAKLAAVVDQWVEYDDMQTPEGRAKIAESINAVIGEAEGDVGD